MFCSLQPRRKKEKPDPGKNVKNSYIKYFLLTSLIIILVISNGYVFAQQSDFIKGTDGSVLDEVEQSGGKYYENGVETDALTIFKTHGFNTIRLKLWHTPSNEFNSLSRVITMARRAKEKGLHFILDIHYSDSWADPQKQIKPAAWADLPFAVLCDSVYSYTSHVITVLKNQQALPDIVQIGNEVSCGMLWNDGKVCGSFDTPEQWEQFGILIKRGIAGVKNSLDEGEQVKIMIHFDNGGNNESCRWFFDHLLAQDVDFDIIGLSYYPWWHGTLSDLEFNLNDLSTRYEKEIIVVESAYPWTLEWGDNTGNIVGNEDQLLPGYPATVEGQTKFLQDILKIIKNTPDDRGKGFVYWSPEWIPGHPGSPWENLALFDFQGEVLESIKVFEENLGVGENIKKNKTLKITPNPFGDEATVTFRLSDRSHVKLLVLNSSGAFVKILVDDTLAKGEYKIKWPTQMLPSGIYSLILNAGTHTETIMANKP